MLIPVLLSGIVFFITHTLEVITGFGGAVLAMPFVTSLIGMREGVMVITSLGWVLAAYIAIVKRKMINWRQFVIICGFMLIGLPIGMNLCRKFDVLLLKRVLAIFITAVSIWHLCLRLFRKNQNKDERNAAGALRGPRAVPYYIILIVGGIIHGMLSTGGPLVVIYASRTLPEKGAFRATLCLLWVVLNSLIIAMYIIEGSFTSSITGTMGIIAPFIVLGIVVGDKIHDKLNERMFSIIVFAMLLVTGAFILFL
jgi:uncharacterized membrane protein YfcA